MRDVSIPALQFEGKMALGSFAIKKQWLSPAAIQYFLTYVSCSAVSCERTSFLSPSPLPAYLLYLRLRCWP